MKKNLKKAALAGLLALTALSMAGCGKKSASSQIDLKDTTYELSDAGIEGVAGDVGSIFAANDRIYIYGTEYKDLTEYPADWVDGMPPEDAPDDAWDNIEYKSQTTVSLYSVDQEGKDLKKIWEMETGDGTSEEQYPSGMTVTKTGEILVLMNCYNDAEERTEFSVRIYDADGKEKTSFSLMDLLKDEEYVQTILADPEGRIYLHCDQRILVIDQDARELFSINVTGWINGIVNDKDGNVLYVLSEEGKLTANVIDPAKKSAGKSIEIVGNSNQPFSGGLGEYDFYMNDSNNLVGYKMDGSSKTLLNWVGSNINSQYVTHLAALPGNSFFTDYNDYSEEGGETGIKLLKKVDPSVVAGKVAITYGGMYIDESVKAQAIKYNKSQNKYQIILRDYSNEEDPAGKFNADLLAGDVPDLIDLSSLPVDKYVAKGMLADLYPFIDKDPDLNKEDFIDNILKTLETDGKLYYISPTFSLNLLGADKDVVGDKTNITLDDLIALEEKYEGSKAFSSNYTSNSSALLTLCQNNYESFIDWNTGKCSFDSDEFVKTLEYANTYPSDEDINYDDQEGTTEMLRSKKTLFTELYNLSFEEIELYDSVFNHKAAFIGYPSDSKKIGISTYNMVGIYAKSANAEGAWDFYRTMLTREYMSDQINSGYGGMPTRKDAYADLEKKVTATKAYTDDFGHEIEPIGGTWGMDDVEVEIKPLNEDQVALMRDIVANVDHRVDMDNDIMNIITEEAGALFSKQKSAKEVAGIIQNRVSTYVNENR
ncbi:MAG: hypothetical protein K6E84_01440 [Lachnospiraceae bacterium]|nr:hypothetical protein [Lachnospiraceae bacterium]